MGDFNRILVPIDGSVMAEKAAEKAVGLALLSGGAIDFLYVAVLTGGMNILSGNNTIHLTPEAEKTLRDSGNAVLDKILQKVPPKISVKSYCETGDPKSRILEFSQKLQSDVIIMGSRGLNPAQSLLLGSVSQHLIENAKCMVLVVK